MTDMVIPPDYEQTWRELAEAEMRYRGYSEAEIEVANRVPVHTPDCEFEGMQWSCRDEYGKSFHPIADEYGEIVDVLGRALEALAERSVPQTKSLVEVATRLGRELGRREAAEEIAQAIENNHGWPTQDQQTALTFAAQVARNIAARDLPTKEPK